MLFVELSRYRVFAFFMYMVPNLMFFCFNKLSFLHAKFTKNEMMKLKSTLIKWLESLYMQTHQIHFSLNDLSVFNETKYSQAMNDN